MYKAWWVLVFILFLSGCVSPLSLGISEPEWQSYSKDQREKLLKGYYQNQEYEASQTIPFEQTDIADDSTIYVKIAKGCIKVPPYTESCSYKSVEFEISSGDCRVVELTPTNGEEAVEMQVCYNNHSLYLDPSRYDVSKRVGSIHLCYSPIWERGFTYHNVSSSGFVRLSNADVTVRILSSDESEKE